nr:exocyst complex component SEC3A-like isoform X1 [Tanacetum cinerariifolium]
LLVCILHICKDQLGRMPKVVGIDIVELALWAKEHQSAVSKQHNLDGLSGDGLSGDIHMREDIEAIETRNNKLEMQSINYKSLVTELEKLLARLHIPPEVSACLASGTFDESHMSKYIEACDWIRDALRGFDSALDPRFAKIRAVKEKRAEVDIIKLTFVRMACEFLRDHFVKLVDSMMRLFSLKSVQTINPTENSP